MYLPGLPAIKDYFRTTVPMVQLGLTTSMLGLAVGQIFFGPLSDKYGRRKPLIISMALFLISTLACIFSPNIKTFVLLRFIQGCAAAGGVVIARSIATDKFKGANLAKALAIVGAINGIAPVAAPVAGGAVLNHIGWKGIFILLFILGIFITSAAVKFKESLSEMRKSKEKLPQVVKLYGNVIKNKKFVMYTLQLAFALAILFAYISSSPFIIQNHYGFGPFGFSMFFGANAVSIGLGAALSARFKDQNKCIKISVSGMIITSLALFIILINSASVLIFEAFLLALCFMLGLTFTAATTLAMDSARNNAGTASAVLGASGFLFGSIVSPIVGLGDIMFSTGLTFTVLALLSAATAFAAGEKEY